MNASGNFLVPSNAPADSYFTQHSAIEAEVRDRIALHKQFGHFCRNGDLVEFRRGYWQSEFKEEIVFATVKARDNNQIRMHCDSDAPEIDIYISLKDIPQMVLQSELMFH